MVALSQHSSVAHEYMSPLVLPSHLTPVAGGDELVDMQSSQAQQQETSSSPEQIPLGHVHLCDINPGMLQEGFRKAQEAELGTLQAWLLLQYPHIACCAGGCVAQV